MPLIVYPDVELWAVGKIRAGLAARGITARVSTSYRGDAAEVVVRRDGGPQLDRVRESARLGVNVYRKGDPHDQGVNDLAALVSAILRDSADATVPRVRQASGASPIPEAEGTRRRYLTFELTSRGAVA